MIRYFAFLVSFIFTQVAFGQSVSRAEEEKAYTQAISEYLKAAEKRHGPTFDTLIIGKRPDFPAVSLPNKVANTTILFLTQKETDKKRKYNPKLTFVNMVGTVTKGNSNFIFVAFYPGYTHQYDCMIDLTYNTTSQTFKLDRLNFKNYAHK